MLLFKAARNGKSAAWIVVGKSMSSLLPGVVKNVIIRVVICLKCCLLRSVVALMIVNNARTGTRLGVLIHDQAAR